MRTALNPLREEKIKHPLPPDIPVVAVITHLPSLKDEYHRDRLEIIYTAIRSATKNAGEDHCFVVWDNGSVFELLDELMGWPWINQIIASNNIGKQNAINAIYGMFSGSIVSISDDDILHYPGWLKSQIEILQAFDNVGLVSGATNRYYMRYPHLYAYHNDEYKKKAVSTPKKWDVEHGISIGKEPYMTAAITGNVIPYQVESNGVKAIVGGSHCQFTGCADVLRPLLPRTDRYMEPLYPFDIRVDKAGLYRFLTPERTTRHLGNRLTDEDRQEIERVLK